MERRQVVLDSSVVVKWFSKEDKSEEALKLLDSYLQGTVELVVSELLFYEVGNALRFKPDYDAEKLKKALTNLFHLQLKVTHLTENPVNPSKRNSY
jgi:predicted nucleic acid-binding protein